MATYKGIRGFTIQNLSADPPNPVVGQVWYNTTSATMKGRSVAAAGWSTGNNLTTATSTAGLTGTQTAAINMAGFYDQNTTMLYDGTNWTAANNLTYGRNSPGAFGTSTAAICAGGYKTDDNATYT